MKYLPVLLIGLAFAAFTLAQDGGVPDAITWTLVSEEPVSPYGGISDWNSTYNEPGAVIFHDGRYHLFVNG